MQVKVPTLILTIAGMLAAAGSAAAQAPAIQSAAIVLPAYQSASYQVISTNSPLWFAAANLPPGLTIDAATGLISGTAFQPNSYFATVTAGNAAGSGTGTVEFAVTAPLLPTGTYTGILTDTAATASGFATITVGRNGRYTADIDIGVAATRFASAFNEYGVSLPTVTIRQQQAVMQILAHETNIGVSIFSDGMTSAGVVEREGLPPTPPPQGAYTFALAASAATFGSGYGTISLMKDGAIAVAGRLNDGRAFSQKTGLRPDGTFPLFARAGSVLAGDVAFNPGDSSLTGSMTWMRPEASGSTISVMLAGGPYIAPKANVSPLSGANEFWFSAFGSPPCDETAWLVPLNQSDLHDYFGLTLRVNLRRGLFSGRFADGESFDGALLQEQDFGAGLLFDPKGHLEGSVSIDPNQ